jgi:hypothetical protein
MGQIRRYSIRLAPLTGLVLVGLLLAAIFVGGNTPDSNWSGARVATFYENHQSSQNADAYFLGFSALFVLFFAAVLSSHVRARSNAVGPTALGFGGAVVTAVGLAVISASTAALTDVPSQISPAALQALNVISNDFVTPLEVGVVAFLAGYGIAIAWTGALPRWLGWLALVVAIACAIPPLLFFALLGVLVWVLIVTVLMLIREWRSPAAPAAATEVS